MDIYGKLCVIVVATFIAVMILLTFNKMYIEPVRYYNSKIEFLTSCDSFPALDRDQCVIMWYTRNAAR